MTQTAELEAALRREWPILRESHDLCALLPSARRKQWVHRLGVAGYVTLDYRLIPGLELPGAFEGQPNPPTLVEKYWSVRTLDGGQDPDWKPSLNVNVVSLHDATVTSKHVEAILRNALVAQRAAWSAGKGWFGQDGRAELYVRAVLLGRELSRGADTFAALDEARGIPLRIARFTYSIADGFRLQEPADQERLWHVGLAHGDDIADIGRRLFADDQLPHADFEWHGSNDSPIYDASLGMTLEGEG